jgi:hypothetical protein
VWLGLQKEGREVIYTAMGTARVNANILCAYKLGAIIVQIKASGRSLFWQSPNVIERTTQASVRDGDHYVMHRGVNW